jgi:hypothetical protein
MYVHRPPYDDPQKNKKCSLMTFGHNVFIIPGFQLTINRRPQTVSLTTETPSNIMNEQMFMAPRLCLKSVCLLLNEIEIYLIKRLPTSNEVIL